MDASELGELRVVPLNQHVPQQISRLAFSPTHDLLWAGSEEGFLYALESPSGIRYSSSKAHRRGVIDLVPATRDGAVLSVSSESVGYHHNGGLTAFSIQDKLKEITCCGWDSQSSTPTGIVGLSSGEIHTLNVARGELSSTIGPVAEGVQIVKGGDPHGCTAFGTAGGQVCLADSRQGFKVQQLWLAHGGGVVDLDLSGGLLASCGMGTRQGQVVADTIVKVYDLRATAKVMTTVPFSPGPSFLKFHPRYTDVLYVASPSGRFMASKLRGSTYSPLQQVETGGSAITGMDISASGECVAFGGSSGYVHYLAFNHQPRINFASTALDRPTRNNTRPPMQENDSFAALLPYFPTEGKLLSDRDYPLSRKCLPPRTISASFLASGKKVDFVTYVENPYKRLPKSEAIRKIAALRNTRLSHGPSKKAKELAERHFVPKMASVLPYKYRLVPITVDQERKFQEFNFSKHNKTRFAGLENGIANCYANALVQVLYFMPQMRAYFLQSQPDAGKEFSLLDELGLLFRMLASESGAACQATNLLRALRQSQEATGLGLLEGHAGRGAPGSDIEVETSKEKVLSRRVQNLQRFLLDKIHHEISQRHKAENAAGENTVGETGKEGPREGSSKTKIEEVFGMTLKQSMQSLQANKAKMEKDMSVFQVDLRYASGASSPTKGSSSTATSKAAAKEGVTKETAVKRPFSDVLTASLRAEDESRAWFNDELQYQFVKRSRRPVTLPQVLAVGTNIHDPASSQYWQPSKEETSKNSSKLGQPWLPVTIAVDCKQDDFAVVQADTEGLPPCPPDTRRTVYSLTAAVALIHEEHPFGRNTGPGPTAEGHLVAHVRVPTLYLDDNMSTNPTPRAAPDSPGYTPLNRFRPPISSTVPDGSASHLGRPGNAVTNTGVTSISVPEAAEKLRPDEFGLPDDPFGVDLSPSLASGLSSAGSPSGETGAVKDEEKEMSETDDEQPCLAPSDAEESGTETDKMEDTLSVVTSPDSFSADTTPERFSNLRVSPKRVNSLPGGSGGGEPVWLLINDFAISTVRLEEVLSIFGGHKLPCLLYYTQESVIQNDVQQKYKIQPAPVLNDETSSSFHALCKQPPLQSALFSVPRVNNNTFIPLDPSEGPRPGQLLGLDAEFVAFSPPAKSYSRGKEIETAPSRLGLARVSVIRGSGPQSETACIDDYIRAVEPVTDYLTQYSGLKPGDLDPSMSRHHLTTMKVAYLKLRYLVDTGCIFVGHGLKKDFRMINLVVPPSQVIDTVDLFYLKRQRKLSLRFLAAYLLKSNIQRVTHDSIEDARTAVQLYQLYCKLVEEGRVREVIQELYAFGKQHGWDPTALSFPTNES